MLECTVLQQAPYQAQRDTSNQPRAPVHSISTTMHDMAPVVSVRVLKQRD